MSTSLLKNALISVTLLMTFCLNGAEINVDSLNDSGPGSLRDAVLAAGSGDTIMLRAEGELQLEEPIILDKDLRIEGKNGPLAHVISGSGGTTLFRIDAENEVILTRLTLTDGFASDPSGNGGILFNSGHLTVDNVVIEGAEAPGMGGGIFSQSGSLRIAGCYFLENTAGGHGGAVAVVGGTLGIASTGFGGLSSSGTLAGNLAGGDGGALFIATAEGISTIESSTFSQNTASRGGGFFVAAGNTTAVNLTLVGNRDPDGGLSHVEVDVGASLSMASSLIEGVGPDLPGISGSGSISLSGLNLSGDKQELGLGQLGDYGGLSVTYPLLPGSPAIDTGDESQLPAEARDQRGLARFSDGDGDGEGNSPDLGAFEIQHYLVTAAKIRGSATGGSDDGGYGNPFDPSDDADSISSADVFAKLSQTGKADIGDAVGANNAAGGGSVSFSQKVYPGSIYLKGSELEIRRDLAIYGPGADLLSIDGDHRSPVIRIGEGASVYIEDVSVENGYNEFGAGIIVEAESYLELQAVSMSGNAAGNSGGGVAVLNGNARVYRSTLIGNSAGNSGGAIYGSDQSRLDINNSTLSYNEASSGGALASMGILLIDSSTLVGNSMPTIQLGVGEDGYIWNSILLQESSASLNLASEGDLLEDSGYNLTSAEEPFLPVGAYTIIDGPVVQPLALNDGTTLSHAPVAPGPAINAGMDVGASEVDQRGLERIRGDRLDIGSIEFQNDAPRIIRCSAPPVVECGSPTSNVIQATVWIDEPDGDAVTITWSLNGDVFTDSIQAGVTYPVEVSRLFNLPYGSSILSVSASDSFSSSATCYMPVSVVDNTDPVLTVPGSFEVSTDPDKCTASISIASSASDSCSGIASLTYRLDGTEIEEVHDFPLGSSLVEVTAVDVAGNSTMETISVMVLDTTVPSLVLPDDISVNALPGACSASVPFAATATDDCSGIDSIVYTTGGIEISSPSEFAVGVHTVTATATDGAGNTASGSFLVTVLDVTAPAFSSIPLDATLQTDPGYCSAEMVFEAVADDDCSGLSSIVYTHLAPDGAEQTITSPHRFEPGVHMVTATATDSAGNSEEASWTVEVSDDFLNCLYNVSWPNALPLDFPESETPTRFSEIQQFLALTDQARWYRFSVQPGSRITVLLTELPENYDIVVYKDIEAEYLRLLELFNSEDPEEQKLSLLGVEFAPESFSPESFSPESFSPESFSPESFSPESFSPESFSPESFSPESFSPESFSPESFSPESFSPESFSPESFSPESFSPESFSPESFSPESFSPVFSTPESFSPESFSAAQVSSIVAYSAFPGIASEGVTLNTFTRSGNFYIRVKGANGISSSESPFKLDVIVEKEICEGIITADELGASTLPEPVAANYKTLIVWDSLRTPGDADFVDKLNQLASRPEVNGALVDVSSELRVVQANLQGDENPGCPFAKNLVAGEIKTIIDAWREVNPTLEYIVLIGSDEAIPFFRTDDEAFLANEANYIPPVRDSTHSQSSLRYGQILTQDPYGATCELALVTGPFPYPHLAVGRLVESVADISAQIDNYIATNGLLEPTTGLVTGYDFLDDAARAVQSEFENALGGPVDSLIADSTLSPSEGWSSSELASAFLGERHDLVFLAGHFSTGSSLAADYETRLTAAQVLASNADLLNTLIFSVGCHSGYNTVDDHAIESITKQPDWAQAFAKMGATFIAGTGYQYGDTEFVEYSERLYLEFARQLRTGQGPVSVGKALNNAKRRYLSETPLMRGIHEKSLLQTTLFGLPMLHINVPGTRTASSMEATDLNVVPVLVPAYSEEYPGPGRSLGLKTTDVSLTPVLVEKELILEVEPVEPLPEGQSKETVVAKWFEGSQGIVTNPVEPVRPLEAYLVSSPDTLMRGVGFRGGAYEDIAGFLPLTGAPTTEIRGVYGNFLTEVFYPVQPYSLNYLGAVCGGTEGERLNLYPSQFLSTPDQGLGGILRKYSQMDFRFYYSDNRETYFNADGDAIIPALAPQPSIAKVSSLVANDAIEFSIHVLGSPAAGIHEVWITHTREAGLSQYGEWSSVDLVQDAVDSTLWKGSLPLDGSPYDNIRYIVQAASGTGLVSMNTNSGKYFIPGSDGFGLRTKTRLIGLDGPDSAAYGESVPVSVILQSLDEASGTWEPLSGRTVGLRVGTSRVLGTTESDGTLNLDLTIKTRPSSLAMLQAYFSGDSEFAPSTVEQDMEVVKQSTQLVFVDPPSPTDPVFGSDIVVALVDGLGTPLKERTVFFLVEYENEGGSPGLKIGNSVITDFLGRADLSEVNLPAGTASITAFYNDIILPEGTPVSISDELYNPAAPASIPVTLAEAVMEDSLGFDPQQVDVYYKSGSKGNKSSTPLYESASISGDVAFNVQVQPQDLLQDLEDPDFIEARVEAVLAGEVIASETFLLDTRGNNGTHWTTTSRPGKEVSYVGIHWSDAPRFDSGLSETDGPRIYTTFIGNNYTEYHFIPEPGRSYTTQFPGDGPEIVVKNGEIQLNNSTGLVDGAYSLDENELVIDVKQGLLPGDEFVTTYSNGDGGGTSTIVVQEGINYLEEGGRMIIRLNAQEMTPKPASDATPNRIECRFILGSGDSLQVRSIARIGEGIDAVPWSSEDPGHKQYRP